MPTLLPAEELSEERFALALDSYKAGYFMIEIVPLAVNRITESDLNNVKNLALRAMVDALVLHGSAEWHPLEELASDLNIRVCKFGHDLCERRINTVQAHKGKG